MDSTIHRINLYPVSDAIGPSSTSLLKSDFKVDMAIPHNFLNSWGPRISIFSGTVSQESTVPFENITEIF